MTANGKVVKAKAFTKKAAMNRRTPYGVRGFSPAFDEGLQSPAKGNG
jgi:hypothetical protein